MCSEIFTKDPDILERSLCLVTRQTNGSQVTGTGWLCSEDGWIITAGHIFVKDNNVFSDDCDTFSDTISVKFPDCNEMPVKLLYAEKQNMAGIDFAVLSLAQSLKKISPLYVCLDRDYYNGKVRIGGMGQILQNYAAASIGYIESRLVDLIHGNEGFLHIVSENAVQPRYSGGPVISLEAGAVVAIQAMASESGQYPSQFSPVAERRTINAMTVRSMIESYPALKDHLIILKRAFSGFDVLKASKEYRRRQKLKNQYFSGETIDEMILPIIQEKKNEMEMKCDLNQPILDVIYNANNKNCFVLGEEGGSGKTMTLLKLFSCALQRNTVKEIPIYIELRSLPELTRNYSVYDEPGMLISDYLASELYENYFIKNRDINDKHNLRQKLYKELKDPSYHETRYILLLDGLNEVSLARRSEVCEEILYWSRNPYTQVIVTSRYKEDLLIEGMEQKSGFGSFEDFIIEDRQLDYEKEQKNAFQLLIIQKLKGQVISDYLQNCQIPSEVIQKTLKNQRLFDIIRVPMYLTVFCNLYNHMICSHEIDKDASLTDICTRGQLLFEFFGEKRLQITGLVDVQKDKLEKKSKEENRKKVFIFDKIVPYIAFHMAVERSYSITEKNLVNLLDKLFLDENSIMRNRAVYEEYKPVYEIYYDRSNLINIHNVDLRYGPAEYVIKFLVEELHVIKKIQRRQETDTIKEIVISYEFLHENLRDFFAARQMQEDVKFMCSKMNKELSLAHPNIPRTVLEFFGDICREHESRPFCDHKTHQWVGGRKSFIMYVLTLLRGRHDKDAKVMISNIISVMQYSRKNDLSGLDLHDLDFTETWLGGIRFSRAYGNTYLSTNFDGATLHASNLFRNGHDVVISCVRRSKQAPNIIYSADVSGTIIQWNYKKRSGVEICRINETVRDMILDSLDKNVAYIASEHAIYRIRISDRKVYKIYETKDFIWNIRFSDAGISYKTDRNPVTWIQLIFHQDDNLLSRVENGSSTSLWLVAHSAESSNGQWLVTGGNNKSHRVQVFHKNNNGDWNRDAIQTISLPYGNGMNWIEMSTDNNRILFCVQKNLYEYSFVDGMLSTEMFRLYTSHEILFASYWYTEKGEIDGIIYADGTEIVLLDRYYKETMRLNSGNGDCYYVTPLLVDHAYRFSTQNGLQKGVLEKYYLNMNQEVQEFDADTNICSRIFQVDSRSTLGYSLNSQKVRLFFPSMQSVDLETSEFLNVPEDEILFIDNAEIQNSVSFSSQIFGKQLIMYDRYTGETDCFYAYRGLFIQQCTMRNIKGEMKEPTYQEILRRYGAIL